VNTWYDSGLCFLEGIAEERHLNGDLRKESEKCCNNGNGSIRRVPTAGEREREVFG